MSGGMKYHMARDVIGIETCADTTVVTPELVRASKALLISVRYDSARARPTVFVDTSQDA